MAGRLVVFPLPVERISRRELEEIARQVIAINEAEATLRQCWKLLTERWTRLRKLKREVQRKRAELIERLARGAELVE